MGGNHPEVETANSDTVPVRPDEERGENRIAAKEKGKQRADREEARSKSRNGNC